ncbi:chloride channel protein [Aquisalinus flavus]|uniref:Chloride channel protein n=2 Tax=Aquisalinus flavus TaxID=1526572 RepID=A0A8J2Y2Y7_9PROT|nr:chloride channel protein [Aquisalinus flavus]GGC96572.1 chloride channel protein [Aquisalinus flavus]
MVKPHTMRVRLLLWLRHARQRAYQLANYKVWILSALIGVVVGYGVIGFSLAIDWMSALSYGEGRIAMASGIRDLNPARAWIVPVVGGVAVGALLYIAKQLKWLPEVKFQGVAEVIEARAGPPGHVSFRAGMVNTAAAVVALGSGASAGREGPAVLLGGAISTAMSERWGLSGKDARTLLGCGAAAAVAASFNAPIAGMLFALEVILGNYALSVFGPVALSSITAAVIARIHLTDVRAFVIPLYGDSGPWDIPFSAALGIVCGLVAFCFLLLTSSLQLWVRRQVVRFKVEQALLPPIAGMLMGTIALFYPEVLGVGYEATTEAIQGSYTLAMLTILLIVKLGATAVCLSCRFGTGVFSGGIFFGAISGAAFGAVLGIFIPGLSADPTFYAMVGMGAVSGAILGAPISTTLIVFELTGDYQMTVALMIAVGIATLISQTFFGSSWFHWQLGQRGYDLSEGPQGMILQTIRVRDVMRSMPEDSSPLEEGVARLRPDHSLGEALARMRDHDRDGMPVTDIDDRSKVIGYITQVRALAVYNRALIESNIEHHR